MTNYNSIFDWSSCQMYYQNHLNSGVVRDNIEEEELYTFFADMTQYVNFHSGKELIKELDSYVKRMLKTYCRGNRNGYCVMIDSLCLLSNLLYQINNNEVDDVIKWVSDTYRDLFYNEKTYLSYVTEDEMMTIWSELN